MKRKNGGYDFQSWKELDKISKNLKFTVKELDKDGNVVVREKQVLDYFSLNKIIIKNENSLFIE